MEYGVPTKTDITTRCPQCSTAFRATAEVLNIANGTVRCGSCLWVFNAHEYDVDRLEEHDESWALELLKKEEEEEKKENQSVREAIDTPQPHPLPFTEKPPEETPEPVEQTLPDNFDFGSIELNNMVFTRDEAPQEKRWPWALGSLAALLLLFLQFAWLNFDTLSKDKPYRRYYQVACHYLSCTLPVKSDIQSITTSHLVVRSHPEKDHALQVDAIIVNNADFEQFFPALHLVFRNINNDIVSSRHFQPNEYLRGDLIDATLIPAKQAVQLSLAIVDPGESAISYHLDITEARRP